MNVRNIAAFFMSSLLIISGKVKGIRKRAANGEIILSVYFHDPSKKLFESTIKWFLKKGFNFITVTDLELIARGQKDFPKSAVIITADDGWKNNKENIARVANKYQIPVTIFASAEPISNGGAYWWSYIAQANRRGLADHSVTALKKVKNEDRLKIVEAVKQSLPLNREALTIEELQEISNTPFVSIGSHTVTHPILTSCSDETSRYEISESKKILEGWLHKDISHFAYPNGNYTHREIGFLKQSGYKAAFTTNPQYITKNNLSDLYTLPRFDILEDVSFTENICRMTGAWFNRSLLNAKK